MFLPSTMTLKFGDSGDFVSELQRRLAMAGCFQESMVNGFFDGPTTNGVMAFQGWHGLTADGVAGPETLRRLNGVISGDTSSSAPTDTKEEEKPVEPASPVQQFVWGAAPVDANPFIENAAATTETVSVPEPVRSEPRTVEPTPAAAQQPSGYDALAALVQSAAPRESAPPAPITERAPLTSPTAPMGAQQAAHAAVTPQAAHQPPQADTPPAPQGLMGRAVQFANAMMQKLSDYFEAKLPPSVLHEVKAIGHHMAQSGVKEIPIPAAPAPVRTVEQPARGVEHGQQRG